MLGITTIAGALWLRGFPLESLLEKWDPAHWSAWLSYIALVTLMQMLWFPRMSTHFLGGIIFPWPFAGLLALVGDMTSAILGFLLGRYFGATRVEARLERRPKAKGVVEVIRKGRPLSSVALARTLPVAHYTAVSYLSGSLGLPFGAYLLGSLLGALPGAALYAPTGSALLNPDQPLSWLLLGLFLLFFGVSPWLGRRFFSQPSREK